MPATLCASRAALREKCEECKQIELTRPTRDDGECSLLWREKRTNEVMARASAIACGYEDAIDDAIDLDRLRHDPLLKVAVGRCPQTGAPLASRSTICGLENAPSKTAAGGCLRLCLISSARR